MTINLFNDTEEHLAHVRAQILTDLSAALRALDQAATHIEALRSVDTESGHGRDGRDVAAHLDDAIRCARGAYAVVTMIIDKQTPC